MIFAALVTAACGAAPPPSAAPPKVRVAPPPAVLTGPPVEAPLAGLDLSGPHRVVEVDWSAVRLASDADALALWQRIAPTGLDWELRVAEIPDERAIVGPLALAQLRHADLSCASVGRNVGCTADPGVYEVAPTATWADPCLQRELALWSVAQLGMPDFVPHQDLLLKLVSRPADDDLADAVLSTLEDAASSLRLRLMVAALAAGNRGAVEANLEGLPTDVLSALLLEHHVDGVLERLDVDAMPQTILTAARDRQLAATTQSNALSDLVHWLADRDPEAPPTNVSRGDVVLALRQAVADAPCPTATHALELLEELGVQVAAPRRARTPAEWRRVACIREALGAPLVSLFAAAGVRTTERLSPLPDDDGAAAPDLITHDDWAPAELAEVPFGDELFAASTRCRAERCRTAAGDWLTLTFARKGGALRLGAIELHAPGRCVPGEP